MPIQTPLNLRGSDSRDRSIRPRKNFGDSTESRQAIRFAITLPVRYRAAGESGWGELVNISSRGALFRTDRALALDASVEVYIKWPVLLHNSVQLRLIASGKIIRAESGQAAVAIEKYQFRTCVSAFFQRAQSWQLPGRARPAQQIQSEPHKAHLEVPHPGTSGAAGWLVCPQRKPTGEHTKISKNSRQRNGDGDDVESNNER